MDLLCVTLAWLVNTHAPPWEGLSRVWGQLRSTLTTALKAAKRNHVMLGPSRAADSSVHSQLVLSKQQPGPGQTDRSLLLFDLPTNQMLRIDMKTKTPLRWNETFALRLGTVWEVFTPHSSKHFPPVSLWSFRVSVVMLWACTPSQVFPLLAD